jgi:hypothetical protein
MAPVAFERRSTAVLANADLVGSGRSPLLLAALGALLIGIGLTCLLVRKS